MWDNERKIQIETALCLCVWSRGSRCGAVAEITISVDKPGKDRNQSGCELIDYGGHRGNSSCNSLYQRQNLYKIWASVFILVMHPFQHDLRTRNKKCSRIHGILEEAKLIYMEKISKQWLSLWRVWAGINRKGHEGIFSGDGMFCMLLRVWVTEMYAWL